jgi:hypothetical protein
VPSLVYELDLLRPLGKLARGFIQGRDRTLVTTTLMKRRRICGDGKVPPAGGLVVLDGIVTVESYPNMNPGNTGTSMLSQLTILTRGT